MRRRTLLAATMLLPLAPIAARAADATGLTIDRAWARATPGSATVTAAYLRIASVTGDRLIGLSSPICRKAELHTSIQENGVMQMREVEGGLPIPPGQRVELQPGGPMHIMLIDLKQPLKAGDKFTLILTFEKAGPREIAVSVEKLGAMGPSAASEIGGPFTLVDQDGHTVTDDQFRGKWMLVYFGYTHCPDFCPTALSAMAQVLGDLDTAKRQTIQAIFITVDPARDTASVMKDYVDAFEDAHIIGLTGTQKQIDAAEFAYRIFARRHDLADGDYSMGHTSAIHIMDPNGEFVALAQPEQLADRLKQHVP